MLAVNYSQARENFKDYCDHAVLNFEPVIVTRKENQNVVIISLDEYNNMKENLYITSNRRDYERILKSKGQIESGMSKNHDLIEVEDNE